MSIGKWTTLKEDKIGLYVEGFLTKGVSTASDVYHAVQAGTIDGLSVGIGWKRKTQKSMRTEHSPLERFRLFTKFRL